MKSNIFKTTSKFALVLIPTLTLSLSAIAHDPALHVKKAEKADCSNMDHSKMNMKDPVAIAMMKKCKKQAKTDHKAMDHSNLEHSKTEDNKKLHKNH